MKNHFGKFLDLIKKYKLRILIGFGVFILFYIILLSQAARIETLATFPGIRVNVQDIVGHVKSDFNFEEINISDSQ
jgi:hypothetical protein